MEYNEYIELEAALGGLNPLNISGKDFVPKFMYGSHTDMLVYLNQKRKEGGNAYPLIWVETPIELDGFPLAKAKVKILLATITNSNISNTERTKITFQTTLDPLLKITVDAINGNNSLDIQKDEDYSTSRHFNYDTNKLLESSDIWDAILLKCIIRFNLNCK